MITFKEKKEMQKVRKCHRNLLVTILVIVAVVAFSLVAFAKYISIDSSNVYSVSFKNYYYLRAAVVEYDINVAIENDEIEWSNSKKITPDVPADWTKNTSDGFYYYNNLLTDEDLADPPKLDIITSTSGNLEIVYETLEASRVAGDVNTSTYAWDKFYPTPPAAE